jgi:hypothetical protein
MNKMSKEEQQRMAEAAGAFAQRMSAVAAHYDIDPKVALVGACQFISSNIAAVFISTPKRLEDIMAAHAATVAAQELIFSIAARLVKGILSDELSTKELKKYDDGGLEKMIREMGLEAGSKAKAEEMLRAAGIKI